jgi:hypothetical protein
MIRIEALPAERHRWDHHLAKQSFIPLMVLIRFSCRSTLSFSLSMRPSSYDRKFDQPKQII